MKLNINKIVHISLPFFIVIVMVAVFLGCKKEGRLDYVNADLPAPQQVSDIKVNPTPGGVILTYKIPDDPNFYYAKAVYEIQPNVFREAKASLYNDTLKLVGFGDSLVHDVKIYSVGKNEKASEPITTQVQPLTPAVLSVFKTVQIVSTFGGVQVDFKNPSMDNLAIIVMKDTTNNNTWNTLETFYTAAGSGKFSIRGQDSVSQKYAVYIRDRWYNKSDTLQKTLKPIFEQEIPKNTWSALVLPTDQTAVAENQYQLTNLWDGQFPVLTSGSYNSSNSATIPQWFTIDLGREVVMSRVVEHQISNSGHCYTGAAPKVVEIWGSNNPNTDGSWASWDSLGTFQSFKPSGLPLGQVTDQDINYACIQGENFEFDHILPAYRYIRWKTDQTYSSSGQVGFAELDVYGQIVK